MVRSILNQRNKPKSKRKITVFQLQQLCGFLNFLSRAVVPGRMFTRRLYSALDNPNLKPHHHLRITDEMMLDIQIWKLFLQHPSVFCHPFIDFSDKVTSDTLMFYSDASKNFELGFSTIFNQDWMQASWAEVGISAEMDPSIQYLKLYALTAAVLAWAHRLKNLRVTIFCDNSSMVAMINNNTSKCKNCMILIRLIVLHSLINNVRIFARHVDTKSNAISDSLSRFQQKCFR